MEATELTAPVYAGYENERKDERSEKKSPSSDYDESIKQLLRTLGLTEEDDEEFRRTPIPSYAAGMSGKGGLNGTVPYSLPSSMGQQMPMGYQQMQGLQHQTLQNQGPISQINIQYTAPDGTMYQMGVITPHENRGKGLYNILNGLYGLMMSEGKGKGPLGKAGGKGYSGPKGYLPGMLGSAKSSYGSGKGGYSGSKGSSGGK